MKEYRCQRRRHCSEADLPQCWYCKDGPALPRPLPGSPYASIPGEILTIKRSRYALVGCHIESDKRAMYGAQMVYHSGLCEPNYPVPSTLGEIFTLHHLGTCALEGIGIDDAEGEQIAYWPKD